MASSGRSGRLGRAKEDPRQKRLPTVVKEDSKRVSSEGDKEMRLDREYIEILREELKKEMRQEIEKLRIAWEEKIGKFEEKISEIEKYISEQREEKRKEGLERDRDRDRGEIEGVELENAEGKNRFVDNKKNGYLSRKMDIASTGDGHTVNEGLSEREIGRIKRMVKEKDKEERKENIVIKGRVWTDGTARNKIEIFIKEKLGIEIKVKSWRQSGKVIVVKLESEEMKREVMINKCKLRGSNIFIENDLTWEDRKIQGKINKWAWEERNKGKEVKVGYRRVRVEGVWKKWEEIDKVLEKERDRSMDRTENLDINAASNTEERDERNKEGVEELNFG